MIVPLSLVALVALLALALLASPFPYLAPGAVLGLLGVVLLYRRPAWGLLALVAVLPFEGLFRDSSFSAAKFLGLSLMLVLALQLALRQIPASHLRSNLWPLLLGFSALYLLSLWASDDRQASLGDLRNLLVGPVVFVITLVLGRGLNLGLFCRLTVLGIALTCAMALLSSHFQDEGRAAGLLDDPNLMAMIVAFAVPLALLLAIHSPSAGQRLLWLGCIGLLLAGMTATQSRSGLLVLLLSLGLGVWHYRSHLPGIRPRHLGFAMLALAIAVPLAAYTVPASYFARMQSLAALGGNVSTQADESLGRRASYVLVGGQLILEHPLLGAGPGTFPQHYANSGYAKLFIASHRKPGDLLREAHNTYLGLLAETGIPAALLFIAMIALGLWNFLRARALCLRRGAHEQADLLTHLGISLLVLALFLLFLSVPNLKYLWIMLALSAVLRQQVEQATRQEARP
ncbi:O-antigen ligase [Pseudomonas sp. Irchel 3E20]|uniref:O-antigen ligase family protein n=1 Tax=Pseudomonas sp. Irchel 3E20 TaxID=2008983 RepID=UPI000BA4CC6D|nr:O-antigen ligase family protein [Pseudomonas sp. Irchel 3E20]